MKKFIAILVLIVFCFCLQPIIMAQNNGTKTTTYAHVRKTTNKGKTLPFKQGDTVVGAIIKINNKTYTDKVIKNAPMKGTVTDGVIWPWKSEIIGKKVIKNDDILKIKITAMGMGTNNVIITMSDFYINVGNQKYTSIISGEINSDPGDSKYTSFEATWSEHGKQMRWFIYFKNDGTNWWSEEMRTYDGVNNKWIYYTNGPYFKTPIGKSFTSGELRFKSEDYKGTIYLKNVSLKVTFAKGTSTPTRVETDVGKSLSFKVGDTVGGYQITFDNNKTFNPGVVVKNSPYAGIVTDGVIWPSDGEIKNLKVIDPKFDKPNNATRQITSPGGTISCSKGDTFIGKVVQINGKIFYNALIIDSPYLGIITDGIIWPTISEISGYKIVDPNKDPTQFHQRIIITNNTVSFKKGNNVYGQIIIIGDKIYRNTYIINTNADGTVTNGILWPLDSDIPKDTVKIIFP